MNNTEQAIEEFEKWAELEGYPIDLDEGGYYTNQPYPRYAEGATEKALKVWMASRAKEIPTCIEAITECLCKEPEEFVLDSFVVACRLRKQELAMHTSGFDKMTMLRGAKSRHKLQEMEILINKVMLEIKEM